MALMINNSIAGDACLSACSSQAIFEKRSEAETGCSHMTAGQGVRGGW